MVSMSRSISSASEKTRAKARDQWAMALSVVTNALAQVIFRSRM